MARIIGCAFGCGWKAGSPRRAGLAFGLALIAVTPASAQVAPAEAGAPKWTATTPRQAWAHTDGIVNLKPNHPVREERLFDRLMIQEAFARWGIAYDEGRADVIRSLFTEDGVMEVLEGSATPIITATGPDAIASQVMRGRANQADQRRHAISNVVIESLDGNRALVIAYGIVTLAKQGELLVGSTVIYRGELVRQPAGDWRFARLVIGMDTYLRPVRAIPN